MKRVAVKWIRDFNKSDYVKAKECAICGTSEELELHHYSSIWALFEKWCKIKHYDIETDEQVLAVREEFSSLHEFEIFKNVVTLCKEHHSKLHKLYGKIPVLGSSEKQKRWVAIQAEKLGRTYEPKVMD
jgi:hypothetical protein